MALGGNSLALLVLTTSAHLGNSKRPGWEGDPPKMQKTMRAKWIKLRYVFFVMKWIYFISLYMEKTMRIGFWECLFLEIETPLLNFSRIPELKSSMFSLHSSTQANPSLDAWGVERKRWWTSLAPHPSRSQSCDPPVAESEIYSRIRLSKGNHDTWYDIGPSPTITKAYQCHGRTLQFENKGNIAGTTV